MLAPIIGIIGTGNVGATTAYALTLKNLVSKILLIDINKKKCLGEASDIADSLAFSLTSKIEATDYSKFCEADIIIISAGKPQMPGESRLDLTKINKSIILDICNNLVNNIKPTAIVIVATNPLDIMTYYTYKQLKLPFKQVIGTGTLLDTQRIKKILSKKLNISPKSINSLIIGEHGDSQVPLWSHTNIEGEPITNFNLTLNDLEKIAIEAKQEAYSIIEKKDATYYGIASCITYLCEIIIFNQLQIVPVSFYNEKLDCAFSYPVTLGSNGINKIIDINLSDQESKKLYESIQKIRQNI